MRPTRKSSWKTQTKHNAISYFILMFSQAFFIFKKCFIRVAFCVIKRNVMGLFKEHFSGNLE